MQYNDDALYRLLGKRLRERREALRLTQAQVAEAAERTRTSVANIEAGHQKTPLHVLYAICVALDVDLGRILPKPEDLPMRQLIDVEFRGTRLRVPPKTAVALRELLANEGEDGVDGRPLGRSTSLESQRAAEDEE